MKQRQCPYCQGQLVVSVSRNWEEELLAEARGQKVKSEMIGYCLDCKNDFDWSKCLAK